QALKTYDNLITQILDQSLLIQAQFNVNAQEITILNTTEQAQNTLDRRIFIDQGNQLDSRTAASFASQAADAFATALPTVTGPVAADVTSAIRGALKLVGAGISVIEN